MVSRTHLQLLSIDDGAPGSAGFKLTGYAKEGVGLCRVWLRRKDPWERYLDPRFRSDTWDVRCYTRVDSAFSLVAEFSPASLDELAETYAFTVEGDGVADLSPNGDPVHDFVLAWAKKVTGSDADAVAPEPAVAEAPVEEASEEDVAAAEAAAAAEAEAAAEAAAAEAAAAEAAAAEAAAAEAAAAEAAAAEAAAAEAAAAEAAAAEAAAAEAAAAEAAAAEVAAAEAAATEAATEAAAVEAAPTGPTLDADFPDLGAPSNKTMPLSPLGGGAPRFEEVSDAWDEIAELAERASTGAQIAAKSDDE